MCALDKQNMDTVDQPDFGLLKDSAITLADQIARIGNLPIVALTDRFIKFEEQATANFDSLDARLIALDEKFEKKFVSFDEKFDTLEARFVTVDNRLDSIDDKFEKKFEKLGNKVDDLADEVRSMQKTIIEYIQAQNTKADTE